MILKTVTLFFLIMAAAGCSGPKGVSYTEQRKFIDDLQSRTIAQLCSEVPQGKEIIRDCAGYGVFSNLNCNFLFFGSAGMGYGVITDSTTGKSTYMRMYTGGFGLGSGFKDFREVIVFHDRQTMKSFIDNGTIYSGYTDAAAMGWEKGGSFESAKSLNQGISLYEFTNSGLNLQAVLTGSKYRKDPDLNSTRFAYGDTGNRGLP